MSDFETAAKTVVDACTWLTDEDEAVVTGFLEAGKNLDSKFQTSLLAEYNKTAKYLKHLRPVENVDGEDDDEDLRPLV